MHFCKSLIEFNKDVYSIHELEPVNKDMQLNQVSSNARRMNELLRICSLPTEIVLSIGVNTRNYSKDTAAF